MYIRSKPTKARELLCKLACRVRVRDASEHTSIGALFLWPFIAQQRVAMETPLLLRLLIVSNSLRSSEACFTGNGWNGRPHQPNQSPPALHSQKCSTFFLLGPLS